MKDGLDWLEMKTCFMCGTRFSVLYPQMWRYKRDRLWFCSWHCLYGYDQKGSGEMKGVPVLSKEQKEKALEMALRGESPLHYLKECGARNPSSSWSYIRDCAVRDEPMKYAGKLPPSFRPEKKEKPKVELVYDESIAEEYRREQAEKQAASMKIYEENIKIAEKCEALSVEEKLAIVNGYKTTAVMKPGLGEFYYDRNHDSIDWRNEYGEEVSLCPEDWEKLAEEIPKMLRILRGDL